MDVFSQLLRARLRTEAILTEAHHQDQKARERQRKERFRRPQATLSEPHVAGQAGCYCQVCLRHRGEAWQIGQALHAVIGPGGQVRLLERRK